MEIIPIHMRGSHSLDIIPIDPGLCDGNNITPIDPGRRKNSDVIPIVGTGTLPNGEKGTYGMLFTKTGVIGFYQGEMKTAMQRWVHDSIVSSKNYKVVEYAGGKKETYPCKFTPAYDAAKVMTDKLVAAFLNTTPSKKVMQVNANFVTAKDGDLVTRNLRTAPVNDVVVANDAVAVNGNTQIRFDSRGAEKRLAEINAVLKDVPAVK